jgi:hypothetical protein
MEQRHRHLHDVPGARREVGGHVAGVREHRSVGEHRAPGEAGRAGGVELHEAVVGGRRVHIFGRSVPAEPGLVLVLLAADMDHPLDR